MYLQSLSLSQSEYCHDLSVSVNVPTAPSQSYHTFVPQHNPCDFAALLKMTSYVWGLSFFYSPSNLGRLGLRILVSCAVQTQKADPTTSNVGGGEDQPQVETLRDLFKLPLQAHDIWNSSQHKSTIAGATPHAAAAMRMIMKIHTFDTEFAKCVYGLVGSPPSDGVEHATILEKLYEADWVAFELKVEDKASLLDGDDKPETDKPEKKTGDAGQAVGPSIYQLGYFQKRAANKCAANDLKSLCLGDLSGT